MWPYFPELLEKPVPRYTSYPTAADFGAIPDTALRDQIAKASGDISLYLHIPFCKKICFYCGCNTGAAGRRQRVESYLTALHAEIRTVAALLTPDARVRHVAFGGGSPNAIEPREFLNLVDAVNQHFRLDEAEWSIELDPRSMSSAWGNAIAEASITRASMGVQTFAKHCQRAIGREQEDVLISRSVGWLQTAGVTSLNFDLMYGLPGQSEQDLARSLECTHSLGADRIAVFGYAHVPHLVPRQKMISAEDLPGRQARFLMAAQAYEFLTQQGYEAIGFDHFALPTDPMAKAMARDLLRRNFQGFTDDQSQVLIGLGATAISGFPELIVQNEKNFGRYRMMASQGMLTSSTGVGRSHDDQMRAKVIEGILCHGSVLLSPCLLLEVQEKIQNFVERGLAQLDRMTLSITPDGLPYARVIASLFDSYRGPSHQRFSSAI